MDKKHLLTIGNISKQTGVHIKSLRYYDKIGILPPAHVDRETGTAITISPKSSSWRPSSYAWSWIFR